LNVTAFPAGRVAGHGTAAAVEWFGCSLEGAVGANMWYYFEATATIERARGNA
jgi:hypothetical protein